MSGPKRYPKCEETGKIAFSKKQAVYKSNHLQKKGNRRRIRVYQCEHCDGWHMTKASLYTDYNYRKYD